LTPTVRYADQSHVVIGRGRGDYQLLPIARVHRFDRASHQAKQDPLDLDFIGDNEPCVVVESESYP
jgi:hypothetical protein